MSAHWTISLFLGLFRDRLGLHTHCACPIQNETLKVGFLDALSEFWIIRSCCRPYVGACDLLGVEYDHLAT